VVALVSPAGRLSPKASACVPSERASIHEKAPCSFARRRGQRGRVQQR
jgi:hypothetical protein